MKTVPAWSYLPKLTTMPAAVITVAKNITPCSIMFRVYAHGSRAARGVSDRDPEQWASNWCQLLNLCRLQQACVQSDIQQSSPWGSDMLHKRLLNGTCCVLRVEY
jgi:hypothetical protein